MVEKRHGKRKYKEGKIFQQKIKPWNIKNKKLMNIKMPFCLHWCQSDIFFLNFRFIFTISLVLFVQLLCWLIFFFLVQFNIFAFVIIMFHFFFWPFWFRFSCNECVVHSIMHVQFLVFLLVLLCFHHEI